MLFDFGGTLDADGVPWKERVARLYGDAGVPIDPVTFDPVFYAADDAMVGTIPTTLALEATVARLVRGVAEGLGVDDDAVVDRVRKGFIEAAIERIHLNRPLLEALASRYRLGIVSNFYGNLSAVCDDCGIAGLFDIVVDSTRAGATKPDARIFEIALAALDVRPSEAVFVGDSRPRDMAGARALGMPHVWLRGPGVEGAPCCADDPVIASVRDLGALLL